MVNDHVDRNALHALVAREISPKRFGSDVDGRVELRLAKASMAQLELWTDSILTATTLGELFAE